MSYDPQANETSNVGPSSEIVAFAERLAENAHDIWDAQRVAGVWRHGPTRDETRTETLCLDPYADLPKSEKRYDRNVAMETLKAISALR